MKSRRTPATSLVVSRREFTVYIAIIDSIIDIFSAINNPSDNEHYVSEEGKQQAKEKLNDL